MLGEFYQTTSISVDHWTPAQAAFATIQQIAHNAAMIAIFTFPLYPALIDLQRSGDLS